MDGVWLASFVAGAGGVASAGAGVAAAGAVGVAVTEGAGGVTG